jgi:hypothetical protein
MGSRMNDSFEVHPVEVKTLALEAEFRQRKRTLMSDVRIAMADVGMGDIFPSWNESWLNRVASMDDESARKAAAIEAAAMLKRSSDNAVDITHVSL